MKGEGGVKNSSLTLQRYFFAHTFFLKPMKIKKVPHLPGPPRLSMLYFVDRCGRRAAANGIANWRDWLPMRE